MDQFKDSNYSEDNNNNQNQRPANPYLRPAPAQGQANKPADYIPAWPSSGPEPASGEPNANPYQAPYNPYRKVEPPYVSSGPGGGYTYSNTYPQNAGASTEQPRRVILGATVSRDAHWTQILLGIIALFFVGQMLTGGSLLGDRVDELTIWGALTKPGVVQGEWWRLVTSMFLHVGALHILFNGIALFVFGMQVEQLMGSKRFLLIFFLTGIGGKTHTTICLRPSRGLRMNLRVRRVTWASAMVVVDEL